MVSKGNRQVNLMSSETNGKSRKTILQQVMQGVCARPKDSGDSAEIHNRNVVERILNEMLKDKCCKEKCLCGE